jgi:hypothetical protein
MLNGLATLPCDNRPRSMLVPWLTRAGPCCGQETHDGARRRRPKGPCRAQGGRPPRRRPPCGTGAIRSRRSPFCRAPFGSGPPRPLRRHRGGSASCSLDFATELGDGLRQGRNAKLRLGKEKAPPDRSDGAFRLPLGPSVTRLRSRYRPELRRSAAGSRPHRRRCRAFRLPSPPADRRRSLLRAPAPVRPHALPPPS